MFRVFHLLMVLQNIIEQMKLQLDDVRFSKKKLTKEEAEYEQELRKQ